MPRIHFTIKKLVILVCVGVVALTFAFYSIEYALPKILETKYKQQITSAYNNYFPPLDPYLKAMGVSFQPASMTDCTNGPYSPSTPCGKDRSTGYINFDQASASTWVAKAKTFDAYLLAHGWKHETGERTTTFSDIFEPSNRYQQVFINYDKQSQGVHCAVSASHDDGSGLDNSYGRVEITEYCYKYTRSPSQFLRLN